eukprot:m51a1_g4218 hypothetical protein (238) ;mRNA; r:85531-86517
MVGAVAVVEGCVYVVRGLVTSVYILCDPREGLTVIDTGLPCDADAVLEGIRSVAASAATAAGAPLPVRRILITHADVDHIGALAAVRRAHPAAEVISSATVSGGIELGHLPGREPKARQQWDEFVLSSPEIHVEKIPGGATRTVREGDVIPAVPGGLRVIESPGHTAGHVSFYAQGVAGGTLFPGDSCKVSDDASQVIIPPTHLTWDQGMAEQSYRMQLALGANIVCAAHGPVWRRH